MTDPGQDRVAVEPVVASATPPYQEQRLEDAEFHTATAGADSEGSAAAAAGATGGGSTIRRASLWSDAWRELRGSSTFILSVLLITAFALISFAPGLFTGADPQSCNLAQSLDRPSSGHPFGYDLQGCDYYAKTLYGARVSFVVGLGTAVLIGVIALVIGSLTGYYGGAVDAVLARIADVFFALPYTLLPLVVLAVLPSLRNAAGVAFVIALTAWPTAMRLMRSAVLSTKQNDYVQAARALGASDLRILRRHILPNAIAPVMVYVTIYIGIAIGAEATLSFLGIGLQLPAISWGLMLSVAQNRVTQAPHLLLFPGLFLTLAVLGFILLGTALRDALDPRLR